MNSGTLFFIRHRMERKSKGVGSMGIVLILFFILMTSGVVMADSPQTGKFLMRFPDVHGDKIVFVCGEDIWKAPVNGGEAIRLTIHDGQERYPKFSPDGSQIAFTGDYDGNTDVYVMNSDGSQVTRLTFHPEDDLVVGWNPIKNKIIFRSKRLSYSRFERLFMISPDGTGLETINLPEATAGSFSPDGKKIAYTRIANEERTWKRYKGGRAQEIYIYNFETKELKNMTNYDGTDSLPMWIGDKIFFNSDRDNVLNIYSYDIGSGKIEQITHHTDYDVLRPSAGDGKVIYEKGGELFLLDIASRQSKLIPVKVQPDAPEKRSYLKKVDEFITGYQLSPKGDSALIVARGEVFSLGKKCSTRNLTQSSEARDKDAVWSPDGRFVAYLSDKSGEYEIYITDSCGKTVPVSLTHNKNGYRQNLLWSPDSKKIAFSDQTLKFYILDVTTKTVTEVDHAEYENVDVSLHLKPIYDYAWSPDSRFIAYSKMNESRVNQLFIYSLETAKTRCISNGQFNDFEPVFSTDGAYLFFISNRCIAPTFCDFEWEMVYKNVAGIFCMTLQKNGKPFMAPKFVEEEAFMFKEPPFEKSALTHTEIDFDGINDRIEMLPLAFGNYRHPSVNKGSIFFLNSDTGDYNQYEFRAMGPRNLYSVSFDTMKPQLLADEIDGYNISFDGSTIIYKKGNSLAVIKTESAKGKEKTLDLSDLKMIMDPTEEWEQMFNETWRMHRDFYYEPNMKGVDWSRMKAKYFKLLSRATCRQDVRFIIGEMIAELSTSHAYVNGGELKRKPDPVSVGLLGADYNIDTVNNLYRFEKIYRIPDWSRKTIPPLYGPGMDVSEGDYLLAVNGKKIKADKEIYSYFQDMAGKNVTIRVNKKPSDDGARDITVKLTASETKLRSLDWAEHNRQLVEKLSNGQIGYIYFPDTFENSAIDFPRYFYSQLNKKGLVVDARFNGGGLDPDIFMERLDKKIRSYWTRRHSHDFPEPITAIRAHLVCITNLYAGSGGDSFPWLFKERKIGPVIGTRSWGGLVGTSMDIPLIDGGTINVPDYRIYNPRGEWVIENVGMVPDITVDIHPAEMERGYDAQLMKALEILEKKIKTDPLPAPVHQPFIVEELKNSTPNPSVVGAGSTAATPSASN